jgi:hypothetical protein
MIVATLLRLRTPVTELRISARIFGEVVIEKGRDCLNNVIAVESP